MMQGLLQRYRKLPPMAKYLAGKFYDEVLEDIRELFDS